jgi:hypothetical protein
MVVALEGLQNPTCTRAYMQVYNPIIEVLISSITWLMSLASQ